jgi:hypothetical protein
MAIARPIYSSMLSAQTDSDFFRIGNPKVSQLFGLVVLPQHNQPRSEPPPLWQSGLAIQGMWPINATSRTGLMRLFRAQPKRKWPFDPPFQILKTNHQFLDRARS